VTDSRLARTPDGLRDPELISKKKRARASSTPVKQRSSSQRVISPSRANRGESQAPTMRHTPTSGAGKTKPASNQNKFKFSSSNAVHSVTSNHDHARKKSVTSNHDHARDRSVTSSHDHARDRSKDRFKSTKSIDDPNITSIVTSTKFSPRPHLVQSAALINRAVVSSPAGDPVVSSTSSPRGMAAAARPTLPRSLPTDAKAGRVEVGKSNKSMVESNEVRFYIEFY